MFSINQQLLINAQKNLSNPKNIYWVVGGACTGKSTVCKVIAEQYDVQLYDMDAHIYGSYMSLYQPDRHPVTTMWLSADNPLDWQLNLSLEDFDKFNQAANAEYLDLFVTDEDIRTAQTTILVDGGMTHPSLLAQLIPAEQIVCVDASRTTCVSEWETSPNRAEMKQWIFDLPDGQSKWEKFLQCDELITRTIVEESKTHGIGYFMRDENTSANQLAKKISSHFGFTPKSP